MEIATFKVENMQTKDDKVNVMNQLHKYSGVLGVVADVNTRLVQVKYDPRNILLEDMKQDIEKANYRVSVVNP